MDELTQSAGGTATRKNAIDRSRTTLDISNRTDFGLGLVCIHGLDGHLLSVSPAGAKVLGYKPNEMVGRHMHDFLPPDVRDQLPAYLDRIQKDGTASGLMRVMTKSGEERILAYSNICRQEFGKPAYVLGHAADITDLKKAEQQLRIAEQRYRYLLQCSSDVVTIAQPDGSIQFISPAVQSALGYLPRDVVGRNIFQYVHPDDVSLAQETFAAALQKPGYANSIEVRLRKDEGGYIPFDIVANNLLATPAVGGIVITAKDLSARKVAERELEREKQELESRDRRRTAELAKINQMLVAEIKEKEQTENALRESQSLLQAALESTADGILVVDLQGKIVTTNGRFVGMWNIPEDVLRERRDEQALSFAVDQLKSPSQFVAKVKALYASPSESSYDVLEFKDGRVFERYSQPQKIGERVVGRVWSFRDVTEHRQLEDYLRQAQKMEAIGRLAGGIAHDFNNLLMVIMGHCEELKAGNDFAKTRHSTEEILAAALRAASLTKQLLAFSRKQVLAPRLLDVNTVLGDLSGMLKRLIGEDIELLISPSESDAYVSADPAQLDQVIVNLIVNARDAMPKGGRLTLHAQTVSIGGDRTNGEASVPPGNYVLVRVSDTGTGMTQETLSRIFEPFFTTKELGQGTGLGLATAYGVVRQSNGYILVRSAVGQGTTFEIYLPRVDAAASVTVVPNLPNGSCHGSETILLVEDQEGLRVLIETFLERQGYTVLSAGNGMEALSIVDGYPRPIHLLVTDVVMPDIRGTEVAERLLKCRPSTQIIYISGYSDEEITDSSAAFLQKPFRMQELGAKIRNMLDKNRASAA
jgi:two-component system, cell cycle sensor histidine kinase and response regulator CckA